MLHKYSFLPVFSCLIGGLTWWSHVQPSQRSGIIEMNMEPKIALNIRGQIAIRRELIEELDRLVTQEHYYHSIYGHYEKSLSTLGFNLSKNISENYEVKVVEGNKEHLLVNATAEFDGKLLDLVTIDQDFRLHASFEVPAPRAGYLKEKATKYLHLIKDAPAGQMAAEDGVFKGFFKYFSGTDANGKKQVVAQGIKTPVMGVRLQLNESGTDFSEQDPNSGVRTRVESQPNSLELDPLSKAMRKISSLPQKGLEIEPIHSEE